MNVKIIFFISFIPEDTPKLLHYKIYTPITYSARGQLALGITYSARGQWRNWGNSSSN
jgi:hypothetical protein